MVRTYLLFAILGLTSGCAPRSQPEAGGQASSLPSSEQTPASTKYPVKLTSEYLPNLVRLHEQVISGGLPEGDEAFQELVDLGVQTIISVDGAKPDVDAARKVGLRYVHLPHGYDGIPIERVKELAKAVRDLDGPVYIHCHHGKHRSPAAASVACVTAGLIPPSAARAVLELAGTSPSYRGLYHSAEQAQPLDGALLDALNVEYRETADVPPMAEAMVALEHTQHHLAEIAKAGWKTPAKHPDLEPAHQALLLQEHFTELLRTKEVQQQPERFRELLQDSEAAARELGSELRNWEAVFERQGPPPLLNQLAERISTNCKSCHQAFRDTPISER